MIEKQGKQLQKFLYDYMDDSIYGSLEWIMTDALATMPIM